MANSAVTPAQTTVRNNDDLLTVSDAARILGVSPSSLRAWAAAGLIEHIRTPGGHRRFERARLVEWLRSQGADPARKGQSAPTSLPTHVSASPRLAKLIGDAAPTIAQAVEIEIGQIRSLPSRGASGRRARIRETIRTLAAALSEGDLTEFLRDAEWEGFRQGAAGQPADACLMEALSLRRVFTALAMGLMDDNENARDVLERALDRMVVQRASGFAEGVKARLKATNG